MGSRTFKVFLRYCKELFTQSRTNGKLLSIKLHTLYSKKSRIRVRIRIWGRIRIQQDYLGSESENYKKFRIRPVRILVFSIVLNFIPKFEF